MTSEDNKKYLELKRKGIIDKNDNVQLNGEQVPYYFLNEDCTAFNPPRSNIPYQSDEWFYRFLKKHGRLDTNINLKSDIAERMFHLVSNGKYKKRNLIKALRELFPDVNAGVIHRLIKKNLSLRILEIDKTYKTKPYVIKGKYYRGG